MSEFKFAGVTLDWYDDDGVTLKRKFPTVASLPGIIKSAAVRSKELVPNDDFALMMVDRGHVYRKYACQDPGTTAMSVIYFMEHGDKLPEEAQKTAAKNLVESCVTHGLMPPAALTKVAGKSSERVVDVTGKRVAPIVKEAETNAYAVVMEDGSRHYPIGNWNQIKTAENYFLDNQIRMHPEIRRQYATKLASLAGNLGYPLSGTSKI